MASRTYQEQYLNYIPIKYKEATLYVPEEYLRERIIQGLYSMLIQYCDDYIQNELQSKTLQLENKLKTKRSIVGIILLTAVFLVSIMLSIFSFLFFNLYNLGILFLYGVISALGGIAFIGYSEKRKRV